MGRLWLELHITDGHPDSQDFFRHVEFSNHWDRNTNMREIPGHLISKIRRHDCVSKLVDLAEHIELLKQEAISQSLINSSPETKELVWLLGDLKGSVNDLLDHYSKIVDFQRDIQS
jgi:hypothetical protein